MDLEPVSTSDTPLAAYLHYERHKLVGLRPDPNDKKRLVYVFVKEERTAGLMDDFYNGNTVVNLTPYYRSIRVMYGKLKDAQNGRNDA